MTTNYDALYKDLELSPGAGPEEVKRAYFRLVRKYSPEKNPDEFKRIRAAYDALKDGPPEAVEFPFQPPSDPFLHAALDRAAMYGKSGDYEAASSVYEGMLDYVPDEPFVLLSLANAQRLAGHPQKAAKTALRLADLYPDSRDAWRLAAMETYSRGWYKKSLPMFRKAFGLGEKKPDFLTDYAAAARDNGERQEAQSVSREILQREKWTKDTIPYAVQAYCFLAELAAEKGDAEWLLHSYAEFLPSLRRFPLSTEDLMYPVGAAFYLRENYLHDLDIYHSADRCLATIEKLRPEDRHPVLNLMRLKLMSGNVCHDSRFHAPAWSALSEAVCLGKDIFFDDIDDPEIKEFSILDRELCLLKEDPDAFRQDADLVESEYPYFYEMIRDFLDEARTGDRDALFARLKKRFLKMHYKFNGSDFQRSYPEEVPSLYRETKVHGDIQPYIRTGKKIGRNDPCPCGSGKKFKRCCMGKGIYD